MHFPSVHFINTVNMQNIDSELLFFWLEKKIFEENNILLLKESTVSHNKLMLPETALLKSLKSM